MYSLDLEARTHVKMVMTVRLAESCPRSDCPKLVKALLYAGFSKEKVEMVGSYKDKFLFFPDKQDTTGTGSRWQTVRQVVQRPREHDCDAVKREGQVLVFQSWIRRERGKKSDEDSDDEDVFFFRRAT